MRIVFHSVAGLLALVMLCLAQGAAAEAAAGAPAALRGTVEAALEAVTPALVRIHVVETYYNEGREMKYETSGSGVVITPEGHVITNHHVAGHAKQLKCTFANKEEIEAELVGTDPLTDIAVIKLQPAEQRTFPVAEFGDSGAVRVGDHVLAMGSPVALSQSATLGIISNVEMTMPHWVARRGGLEQDGEDVGSLVKWLGHDAAIYGGNSGGPLVDLEGRIIGINEIKMGLGGAIPGNLAEDVARQLIATGQVKRAWLGLDVQPRLKHSGAKRGVLVGGVIDSAPAAKAGLESGDLILALNGVAVDVEFREQLPEFNRLVADLEIGAPVEALIQRAGQETTLAVTPEEREPYQHKQFELKQWGVTVRDLSFMLAREMKRKDSDGVLVTSVRPGGPAGDAKPRIEKKDVIVAVAGKPVASVRQLVEVTGELTEGAEEPTPVLVEYERKTEKFVTVVEVGIKELPAPGREVKKAWLPVQTQVITRDIARQMNEPDLTGFRVTQVYKGSSAEKAGLQVGDLILAVDGERMTASAPEHYEELSAWIRQYSVASEAELEIRRGAEEMTVPVELVRAPMEAREMNKYRDENFEFTVRDVTFFDKAEEKWEEKQTGVLVEQVKPGGWAALGNLDTGDLILAVDDQDIPNVDTMAPVMDNINREKPPVVVLKVLRGIHTFFIELEPKWNDSQE